VSYEFVKAVAESRGAGALVTVIETRGSAPRHSGARMLVRRTGEPLGTVGGGKVEERAREAGLACIERKGSQTVTVEMQGTIAEGPELLCGGMSRMLAEFIDDARPYQAAMERLGRGERVLLLRALGRAADGAPCAVSRTLLDEGGALILDGGVPFEPARAAQCLQTGKPALAEAESVFYDPIFPEEKLLVLGGGHVGQALAELAVKLDFAVTVADERAEFADPRRFPHGVQALSGSYQESIRGFPFDAATYVVVVTHSHVRDLECVRAILSRRYRYAGFIGSARKTKLLREQLKADGFPQQRIDALHAPIGLAISAETPAELAVSILGELVAVRRNADPRGSMSAAHGAH
jgi:xanthine dehydrogenase accessory factor